MTNIAHVVFDYHNNSVASEEQRKSFIGWSMLNVFKSDNAIQFEIETEEAQQNKLEDDIRIMGQSIVAYCPDLGKCSYNDVVELAEIIYFRYVKINRDQQNE